jgi:integration host factor subunit alpha
MTSGVTLTRADLCDAVYEEVGLSRAECSGLVESILGHIGDALSNGENVKIAGFGTFLLRDKPARVGRNPMTGIEVTIPPRRVLTFRASPKMRDRVAKAA